VTTNASILPDKPLAGARLRRAWQPRERLLLPLGADSLDAMRSRLARLRKTIASLDSPSAIESLATRLLDELPSAAEFRCAILAADREEAISGIDLAARRIAPAALVIADGAYIGAGGPFRIGFLFPGQGVAAVTTIGALGKRVPAAAAAFDEAGLSPWSSRELPADRVQLSVVAASLASLVALRELGVGGHLALGHSLGEVTALHWAGAFDTATLLRLARARGAAMTSGSIAPGTMATICADEQTLARLTDGVNVAVACLNAPRRYVVSGELEAVGAVLRRARASGIRAMQLNVTGAFHSPLMRSAAAVFGQDLARERFERPRAEVLSSVTGAALEPNADLRSLLVRQITDQVRFLEVARAAATAADLLLEVGPGRILAGLMSEIAATPVVSMRAGEESAHGLLASIAAAYAAGAPVTTGQLAMVAPGAVST
jgi:enediyne polyketide synthase